MVVWKKNSESTLSKLRLKIDPLSHLPRPERFEYRYSKLVTLVESDLKAPFLIDTTPSCRGGRYSTSRLAPFYPWSLPNNAKRHQVSFFKSLVWLDQGLKPGLLDHWRTLYSLGLWPRTHTHTHTHTYIYIYIYIYIYLNKRNNITPV